MLETKSGGVRNGVLLSRSEDEVVLATGAETKLRVSRADIADLRPGTVSIMPSGLDQQLSNHELADLLAFLKETALRVRTKAPSLRGRNSNPPKSRRHHHGALEIGTLRPDLHSDAYCDLNISWRL